MCSSVMSRRNRNFFNGFLVCILLIFALWIIDIDWISSLLSSPSPSNHHGIYPVAGNYLQSPPPFIPKFPSYQDRNTSLIPTWVLSSPNQNTIHRFFDTSPFSPSGRYVGVTQMAIPENRQVHVGDKAKIIVYDLFTGETRHIAETTAWDSQVGSHVQWGIDDSQLYFNVIDSGKGNGKTLDHPHGVVFDIMTNKTRSFDCPIYQISPNGLYSASPDLTSIRYTQLGYGIFVHDSHPSKNASHDNGLFITDLTTGKCKLLVSLYDVAIFGELPVDQPIYGFHVKWSSDNTMIMFVVRTLTSSIANPDGSKKSIKTARVNHIFTVDALSGKILCHVVSWGSGCGSLNKQEYKTSSKSPTTVSKSLLLTNYEPMQSRKTSHIGGIAVRGDGNHPNWIPDSHKISVNYLSVCDNPREDNEKKSIPVWRIAVFDVDAILAGQKDRSLAIKDSPGDQNPTDRGLLAYSYGTGHPNYYPGGRYFITDAYLKEKRMFGDGKIPSTKGSYHLCKS